MTNANGDRIIAAMREGLDKFCVENGYEYNSQISYYGGEPPEGENSNLFTLKFDMSISRVPGVGTVAAKRIGFTAEEARKKLENALLNREAIEFERVMENIYSRIESAIAKGRKSLRNDGYQASIYDWPAADQSQFVAKVLADLTAKNYTAAIDTGSPGNEGSRTLYIKWQD